MKKIGTTLIGACTVFVSYAFFAMAQAKCTVNGKEVSCDQAFDQAGKFFGGFFIFFAIAWILFVVLGIAATVFWIVMIIHAASKPIENRPMWIIILVFTHIIGALIYYFVVKREFDRKNISVPPVSSPHS